MTLNQLILITGSLLVLSGLIFYWNGALVKRSLIQFGRSQVATFLVFGIGAAWFIYKVFHLGAADEIGIVSREFMLIIFISVALLSFRYVPDFLSIRGLAIVILLLSVEMLKISWMQYSIEQRTLNIFVYIMILIALYLGAVPYRWRDFMTWLFQEVRRVRLLAGSLLAYGIALIVLAMR